MIKLIIYGVALLIGFILFQKNPMTTSIIIVIGLIIYIYFKTKKSRKSGEGFFGKGDNEGFINNDLIKLVLLMTLLNQNQSQPTKLILKRDEKNSKKEKNIDLINEKNQILSLFEK
jgi:hypothetical protein